MNDDIVVQLREEGFITHMAKLPRESKILHAAADEIERLREENKKLMEMKSVEFFQYCKDLWVEKEEADEIERLQDNRDSLLSTNVELEVRIKSIKEGFEGCCTACEPVGEINKKLREERDEARRTICYEYYLARDCRIAPELIAEEMGWDCFGERWKMMQDALDRVAQLGEEIENGET